MSVAVHRILLRGEEHFGGKLPPRHLGLLLAELPLAVRDAVSMALRNRSRVRGRQPQWLACAADVRFIGHGENGATTLYFEAPVLGEAAREIYQQQQLPGFSTRPSPDDTGFDLLGDVLANVQRRDADSGNYDNALLSRIARFHKVLDRKSPYCEIDFTSRRYSAEQPAKVTRDTITSAKSLLRRTPAPQRLRVVGQLDGLEASTQRFSVLLDTGEKVVGVFADDQMDAMRELWRKQVLVLGTAIYRASGRLLRIDAEIVKPGDAKARIFSRMPTPSHGRLNVSELRRPQGPRSGMAAIMGRWPGDESDEENRSRSPEASP